MNHFHRVIFNPSLGVRQVVSEIASSGRGAGSQASTSSTSRAPRLSVLAAACVLAWCVVPQVQAASCDASTSSDLVNCISTANVDTINLMGSITLGANLGVIDRDLTINGNGRTLNGAGTYRGFFVGAGNVTINDLTMTNLHAKGGDGGGGYGPGGGGMGAGGAVFVATDASANLNNVSITGNAATGGNGGNATAFFSTGIGGGGGMGGNGAGPSAIPVSSGGGGLFEDGQGGTVVGGGNGGGPTGGAGDTAGTGSAGNGGNYTGGGGGANVSNAAGGSGGLGGGGGGANTTGGAGGFGGGGGGSALSGGAGGFGGGGGGSFGPSGTSAGSGGFGGANGSSATLPGSPIGRVGGGGGAGMGGAIFVMAGGSLTFGSSTNTQISGNSVTGGAAGSGAGAGSAFGNGIFLQGSTAQLNLAPTSGTQTVTDVIADQTGSAGFGGSVAITKTGAGTTILSGDNKYSGGTTISAGTLQLGNGLASGSITGNVNNNGTLAFNRNNTLTFSGLISGTGSVHQIGTGTTILSGNNTYNGGTTIATGTLQLGNGLASGSITGNVANDGTLAFNRNDSALNLLGVISGSGSVRQIGTGTTILSGDNSYTGGTTITAGTLQVGNGGTSGSITGNVLNNAALAFNRSDAYMAANSISGTGTLTQNGAGNLILTGASIYTGATSVNAGTLSVNGSITSATTVNSGGALGGNGSVGNVNVLAGGTLAPGNSIGTLTVNGNLTFAPGSVYRVETDAAGNADRVNVVGAPGTLTINGGTVDVQAGAGNYARNTRYTILTSTGATTGAFTGVTSNLAFLTPSLSYLSGGVVLKLAEDTPYSTVAQTSNQASTANYLNSFANTPGNAAAAALIQQIDNLTAGQARTAFDSMSGSSHAAASQIAGAMGRNFSATLAARIGFGLGSANTSASSTAGLKAMKFASVSPALLTRPGDVVSDSSLRVAAADPSTESQDRPALQSVGGLWGQATGTGGHTGSDGNGAASRYRASGFVFGYDQPITSNWLAGAALGYNKAQWDASTNGAAPASGRISTPQAGLYARYTDGPWQVRLDGTYSNHRFSTDRTVTIGNTSAIARSSHGGTEWAFAAQAEYSLPSGDWDIRPLAGLRHARLSEHGFTETGAGAADLTVNARRSQNTVASLGVKFAKPLGDQGGKLQLSAIASHLMGDNDSPLSSRLAGQPGTFTAAGTPLKRTALTLGGSLTGQLSRGLSAYADAAYEYRGSGQNAFMFTAGLRLNW
ncbi:MULTISPECIES: autotransporter domain-containing protein [unclassified Polaromonas]|uniref:autotransporter domain-containing protein n=1 Tax=unclassified Polaromonas TaxID=2638319 RepID=UPI0013DDD7AB|nr:MULTISPECIES: autotransporter domain-containing protein [unclassified Polaromonas]